jgi:hypothetical protein
MPHQDNIATRRRLLGGNGFITSRDLGPRLTDISELKPLGRATRRHPPAQLGKIAASLQRFGCVVPVLVDPKKRVVAGWAVVLAARQLGLRQIPAVTLTDLSESELKAIRIALNRIAEDATWDKENLTLEISEIIDLHDLTLEVLGFEAGEIDHAASDAGLAHEDDLPVHAGTAAIVSRPGDLWKLNKHLILCGDALWANAYELLLGNEKAQMLFTDPAYHAPNHAVTASPATPADYGAFSKTWLGQAASHSIDGAVHFVCCNWRNLLELLTACASVYGSQIDLCVNQTNAGRGIIFRGAHALIAVYRVGTGKYVGNVALGKYRSHRTNLWNYPFGNAPNGTLRGKPVAMVADAIADCSNRGGLILDPFGGVGTTIIAAECTGRRARVIEIDPKYVDLSIERWQRLTGGTAIHAETGEPFLTIAGSRQRTR